MNWIDNLIAVVSPEAAYKRQAYRNAFDELRNYDAGNFMRPNQNWRVSNQSAEMTDRFSRDEVRARARDLERNSDIINSLEGAFKRNVIGGGYRVQAKTPDAELNKQLEKLWKRWCKKQNCDVTKTQSFNQILRMAVERKKIDGGILFVKRYTSDGLVPFKLQMFEVDELDITADTPKHGGKVVGGIEYDAFNCPIGYFFRQYALGGWLMEEPVYIAAENVIFYFSKKRPSQVREMSDLASSIPRIRDVNEFMQAVSVKERIEACLSVFIKKSLPTTGIGRQSTPEARTSYDGKLISPGMIKEMNAGDEIQVVNPSGQGADATNFTKLQQRMIGAGQGLSYEATTRDMSEATYSSARQGMIEDNLTYKEEEELIIEILDEIYETFIISAVLSGLIVIKDFWNKKYEYLDHEWTKEPKPWIDPQKESNATATALKTGQKTYKQIAAENGRDWKDQIDDIAEVIEYGKTKGIDLSNVFFQLPESQNEVIEDAKDE